MIIDLNDYIKNKTKVYSLESGVGEITNIFKMYDGISDFFEIRFEKEGITKFISISHLEDIRIATCENKLQQALINLEKKINCNEFDFNLDYHNHEVTRLDLIYIINTIAKLTNQEVLSLQDKDMLECCVDSLVHEVSHTYETSMKNAQGIVSGHMC
ncbi:MULTISPECIES: hypothetical protein [Halobacteriovorax]|uniref:Uncharacterized protein n=1 Tax=Halobacteriovorax vibrionivorans TaxID=2152716 RepID=A0ABY0IFC6_9BACT|nr:MULTISPECIES: hypothetical protein [Halobacteriovorax]AYF43824.1 hypothetical protein BALOs_0814 [Halobacteriovorax sp. BALOs_7]RZF21643.1 hypothetical protein DAY19_08110 [Halobacteriovorax vibrionivorans]TGD49064.1 hypothetical protein EP118_00940 [Halobacteriovorax sp. Y22]